MPQPSEESKFSSESLQVSVLVESDLTVLNISQSGLAVKTERPLVMGQAYHLHMVSGQQSVTLEGEVARCNLSELAQTVDGETVPCYLNGIQFHLERNPLELCFLEILYTNVAGEKRRSPRIKPMQRMVLNIGKPFPCTLLAFEESRMSFLSPEVLDLDRVWKLLILVAGRCTQVYAHILSVAKKEGDTCFTHHLEFVNQMDDEQAWFRSVADRLVFRTSS